MLCKEYVGNVDLLGCVSGLSHGCCKYGQMTWDEWNLIKDNSSGIYIYIYTLNSTSVTSSVQWRIYS